MFKERRSSGGDRVYRPELPFLTITAIQFNLFKCLKTKTKKAVLFFSNRTREDRGSTRTQNLQPDTWAQLLHLPVEGKLWASDHTSCKLGLLICKMGAVIVPTSQDSHGESRCTSQALCTCWLSHRKRTHRHPVSSDRIHLVGLQGSCVFWSPPLPDAVLALAL